MAFISKCYLCEAFRITSLNQKVASTIFQLYVGLSIRLKTRLPTKSNRCSTSTELCMLAAAIMDQVPGRKDHVMGTQSDGNGDHNNNIPCDLCSEAGEVIGAAGFCLSCHEFLCRTCIHYHNRFETNKGHILLTDADMPSQRPMLLKVENCSKHPDRPLEMFCEDDDTIGCTMCFVVGHRACQKVKKISDLSKDIKSSVDMTTIKQASVKERELCNRLRENIKLCRETNDKWKTNCLEDFDDFRGEIEASLDILEKQVAEEAAKIEKENTEKLDSLAESISSYEQNLRTCLDEINKHSLLDEKHNDVLFITVKKNKKQINDILLQLEQTNEDIYVQGFRFVYNTSIKEMLEADCMVEVKATAPFYSKCTYESQICVKSTEDQRSCSIVGMVAISETRFILADYSNECIKLLDVVTNTISKRQALPEEPFDITCLPGSRVAVSLRDMQLIQFFTADENLDPCGNIRANGQCTGLHCSGDKLLVSYSNPAKVEILNLKGKVIRSIQHGPSGEMLFGNPSYLASCPDSKNIYVSDCECDTVTCMDMAGTVKWVYKDSAMEEPTGVTTGEDGIIYICSQMTHSIHVVSGDGVRLAVISETQSGIETPVALCYSSQTRSLYVSSDSEYTENTDNVRRLSFQQYKHIL